MFKVLGLKISFEIGMISLILLLGACLRFYQIKEAVYFEFDDQYNSYLVYNVVKNHKFSLVGQEMSYGGMFLGPWHYLYLTPFYILSNLDPVGGYIGESFIGLITIFSYFIVGKRLFSARVGLLAAFFRCILYSQIFNDRTISPPYPSELVALWFIYFLWQLRNKSRFSLVALSFLFGLMFTIHLSILPLVFVWLILFVVYKPVKVDLRLAVKSVASFFIPISPILLFEVRHDFSHILRLLSSLSSGEGGIPPLPFMDKLFYIINYNLTNFYWLFFNIRSLRWLGIIFFLLISWLVAKRFGEFKNPQHKFIFFTTVAVVLNYYLIYPRHIPEYYFMALTPIIILYVSGLLISIWRTNLGKVFVSLFLGLAIINNGERLNSLLQNPNKFTLSEKQKTVKAIVDHQRGKGDFSISYFMEYGREYGFQYFFTLYGLEPRPKISPPIYSIVLPRSQVSADDLSLTFGDIGIIFPEKEPEQGK